MIEKTIREELKKAMIAKDQKRTETLRGVIAAFGNELIIKSKKSAEPLTDEECLAIIRRLVKQRKDSIEQFTAGNRPDLAENEKAELTILEAFLPQMMSRDEIRAIAEAKKAELGLTDKKEVGKFMSVLMKDLKGKADGADVKAVVESIFS